MKDEFLYKSVKTLFVVMFVLYPWSFWVVSKHKKRQAGPCFIERGNASHREKPSVIRDSPVLHFLTRQEAVKSALTRLTDIRVERPGFAEVCSATVCVYVQYDAAEMRPVLSRKLQAGGADILSRPRCDDGAGGAGSITRPLKSNCEGQKGVASRNTHIQLVLRDVVVAHCTAFFLLFDQRP